MTNEFKLKVGDTVWCRGVVSKTFPDDVPYQINFGRGGYVWQRECEVCPDAPAPAEMDDVLVLRRAVELLSERGMRGVSLVILNREADAIESARREASCPTVDDTAGGVESA